jgi:hypothetical protein
MRVIIKVIVVWEKKSVLKGINFVPKIWYELVVARRIVIQAVSNSDGK